MNKTQIKNNILNDYYVRALDLLQNNKIEEAKKLIFEELDVRLYDKSISLLLDRNLKTILSDDTNILIVNIEKFHTLIESFV